MKFGSLVFACSALVSAAMATSMGLLIHGPGTPIHNARVHVNKNAIYVGKPVTGAVPLSGQIRGNKFLVDNKGTGLSRATTGRLIVSKRPSDRFAKDPSGVLMFNQEADFKAVPDPRGGFYIYHGSLPDVGSRKLAIQLRVVRAADEETDSEPEPETTAETDTATETIADTATETIADTATETIADTATETEDADSEPTSSEAVMGVLAPNIFLATDSTTIAVGLGSTAAVATALTADLLGGGSAVPSSSSPAGLVMSVTPASLPTSSESVLGSTPNLSEVVSAASATVVPAPSIVTISTETTLTASSVATVAASSAPAASSVLGTPIVTLFSTVAYSAGYSEATSFVIETTSEAQDTGAAFTLDQVNSAPSGCILVPPVLISVVLCVGALLVAF